ncbi:glycosyltransferase [Schleiferia thermophila]
MRTIKTIIVSATSDLSTDQRVHKTCVTLQKSGFEVICVGRKLRNSLPLTRPYKTVRFTLPTERGILFYTCYQLWLFMYLLLHKADGLWANDLDTLLPNFLISRIKRLPIAYDSHEYFCGSPEVFKRPLRYKVWKSLEDLLLPRLSSMLTVNASIAALYQKEYGIQTYFVRNISPIPEEIALHSRCEIGIAETDFLIVVQGRGLNVDRGNEELIESLLYLPAFVKLLIIGSGNAIDQIHFQILKHQLSDRVVVLPPMPYREMLGFTHLADLGAALDKPVAPNYLYSLPNKVFDYIHCGVPILGGGSLEVQHLISEFNIGEVIPDHSPSNIAKTVYQIIKVGKSFYKDGLKRAAEELNWKKEEGKLIAYIQKIFSN